VARLVVRRQGEDVVYCEFMGKDNVPFHTVIFPVTIMGSGEPWKLVDRLKGFNWLNYRRRQVLHLAASAACSWTAALEILPADYWRYYLMANAPESSDSNFTWEHFAGR
jgi:methionyl-tRNA synthetase